MMLRISPNPKVSQTVDEPISTLSSQHLHPVIKVLHPKPLVLRPYTRDSIVTGKSIALVIVLSARTAVPAPVDTYSIFDNAL
jgi:hypothetical protein